MGQRMTKTLEWPWRGNPPLLVLAATFVLGGLLGCGYTNLLGGDSAQALSAYLTDYLAAASDNAITPALWSVLWKRLCLLLAAVLSGLTALGVVSAPVLLGVEGFLLTYSIACFYRLLGMFGFLSGVILFGLPALIWAPALFLLTSQGVDSSFALLHRGLGATRRSLPFSSAYWSRTALCAGAMVLCGALEASVIPLLLHALVQALF